MQYTQELSGDSALMSLSGKFMFADHGAFNEILSLIKGGTVKAVTLDLDQVEFIDSAALGMFLIAREESQKNNINLTLRSPQGQVAQMFKVSKFDTLFTIR